MSRFVMRRLAVAIVGGGAVVLAARCEGAVTSLSYDARGNLTLMGSSSPSSPAIVSGPVDVTTSVGRRAAFSVNASGPMPLHYQWYFSSAVIPKATNDSIVIDSVGAGDFGDYYVVVTDGINPVTSRTAHLQLDSDGDGLADSWEIAYFGSITNQNAVMDKDGDGSSNLTEFLDGTNPTNKTALLTRLNFRAFGGDVEVTPYRDHYQTNDIVTLTAVPNPGLTFLSWAGALGGATNPATLIVRSNATVQATFGLPLEVALNITNSVTTGGDGGWYGETNETHDGQMAARTAPILIHPPTASSSWLKTTVTLARDGTVSFWWRSDSPGHTEFSVDNNRVFVALRSLSGVTAWARKTSFLAAGTHTLSWTYTHGSDGSLSSGFPVTPEDSVFVDEVVVTEYADPNLDSDGDGLPDLWEYKYFDTLAYGATDDPDGDGVNNLTEWQDGTIPTSSSSVYPRLSYVIDGAGTAVAAPSLSKYPYGQAVTNSAAPAAGWTFFSWLGPFVTQAAMTPNTNNPSNMRLYISQTVRAIFELPLAQVTDAPGLTWTRGGDLGWYGQTNVARDGISAAQSGPVSATGQSWMETIVQGPGTLSFWWKVDSSTNDDMLTFLVNSNLQFAGISGVVDWQPQTLLLGSGPQTLRWRFSRNRGPDTNRLAAAWVDQVQYLTGPTAPQFVQQPAGQTVFQTSNAIVQVLARGTPTVYYQLYQGTAAYGSPSTNSNLVISNVPITAAGTWFVRATNSAGQSDSLPFTINVLPVPPANDNFANRFSLAGVSNPVVSYNFGATLEAGEPSQGGGSGGGSVWWSWIAPQSGKYRAVAQATNLFGDLLLGVYTGTTVANLTTLGSGYGLTTTDTNGVSVDRAEVLFDAVASTEYAVGLDTSFGDSTWFGLWMEYIPRPPNDAFANRIPLVGVSASGASQNISATAEPGEPSHYFGFPATNSIWWTWTPPRSGPAQLSTLGSSITPVAAVYTGSTLATLQQLASGTGGGNAGETVLTFNAVAGTPYQIAIDTLFSAGGEIQLNVALDTPSLAGPSVSQGGVAFSVVGPAGTTFAVEKSIDMSNWVPVFTNTIPASGSASFQEAVQAQLTSVYYRVRMF